MSWLLDGVFDNLYYWHWWALAFVLLILEMFSPAAIFMWISAAAAVVGLVLLVLPSMSWEVQFLLFAVLSIAAVVMARIWFKRQPIETDHPVLNQRGSELIGRSYVVEQAIVHGTGRVRVGETTWKAAGPDAVIGTSVRVVGIDSTVLQVELA